jgi:hypothetical protein
MVTDLQDRLDRAGRLLRAIAPWAEHPDAGEPGRHIRRLLSDHGRVVWVEADPVAESHLANGTHPTGPDGTCLGVRVGTTCLRQWAAGRLDPTNWCEPCTAMAAAAVSVATRGTAYVRDMSLPPGGPMPDGVGGFPLGSRHRNGAPS